VSDERYAHAPPPSESAPDTEVDVVVMIPDEFRSIRAPEPRPTLYFPKFLTS